MSRADEVRAALDTVVDPCSAAAGAPAGLVEMGIVDGVEVDGSAVVVRLLPTFAGCLFVGLFADEAERRVAELPWCERVTIDTVGDRVWTPDRMGERLRRRRAGLRETLATAGGRPVAGAPTAR